MYWGNGGEVARNWAELMKAMWSGKYKVVVPIDFKKTIGQFAPRFMGFQQQDSQELLSFLLDGIHEDLNRKIQTVFYHWKTWEAFKYLASKFEKKTKIRKCPALYHSSFTSCLNWFSKFCNTQWNNKKSMINKKKKNKLDYQHPHL